MTGAFRIAACAGMGLLLSAAAGCSTTLPASEFITKYTTDIQVPNPEYHKLPTRTYLGRQGSYVYIVDRIPRRQGGGLFGKVIYWRCPTEALPRDFPQAYRPGDVVMDGRPSSRYQFMIQSFVAPARPPAAPAGPPAKPPGPKT
jgi:hypothetical protein